MKGSLSAEAEVQLAQVKQPGSANSGHLTPKKTLPGRTIAWWYQGPADGAKSNLPSHVCSVLMLIVPNQDISKTVMVSGWSSIGAISAANSFRADEEYHISQSLLERQLEMTILC